MGGTTRRLRRLLPVTALAGAVLVAGGVAYATIGGGSTINGCYQKNSGQLRVIDAGQACSASEEALSWNQQGPSGPSGPAGAKGDTGPSGPPGVDGSSDLAGQMCPTGGSVVGFDAEGDIACSINPTSPPPPPPSPVGDFTFTAGPSERAFGNWTIGFQSSPLNITVTNLGSDAGTPSATILGSNSADFSLVSGCSMVAAGATCSIAVRFKPLSIGSKIAQVVISGPGGQSVIIQLSGTGTQPQS